MTDPKLEKDLREFREEVTNLVNRLSLERLCNVPDFIIGAYLYRCLTSLAIAVNDNNTWHERKEVK